MNFNNQKKIKTFSNGYTKAVTLSFDDGIQQDIRLVELLNRYDIKCTFNINYGLLNHDDYFEYKGIKVYRINSNIMNKLYQGHEIATHGYLHPDISKLDIQQKKLEIELGKKSLEKHTKKAVLGMAYPFGAVDQEMIQIMKKCGIQYGRMAESSLSYDLPNDVFHWKPTIHCFDSKVNDVIDDFLSRKCNHAQLLFLWGHSYECDIDDNWVFIENIFRKLSSYKDIWFCTNIDIIKDINKKDLQKTFSCDILEK